MKPTQRDLLTTALLARGYMVDKTAKTTKYVVFKPTAGAKMLLKQSDHVMEHRVFAGKAGALRFSGKGRASDSIPFSENTVQRLLTEGGYGGLDKYEEWLKEQDSPSAAALARRNPLG